MTKHASSSAHEPSQGSEIARARRTLVAALLVFGCGSDPEGGSDPALRIDIDLFERLSDPYAIARPPVGEGRVASSRAPAELEDRDDSDFFRLTDARTLLDASGPGVITRVWLTYEPWERDGERRDPELRLVVDGKDVFGSGWTRTADVVSGSLPAFPEPWVAGPDRASGAVVVAVPIHFHRRATLTARSNVPLRFFHQVDWRALPRGARVQSFDGVLTRRERDALARARSLWVEPGPRGTRRDLQIALEPGRTARLELDAPSVVRRLALSAPVETTESLHTTLDVDGFRVFQQPVRFVMFAEPPAQPFHSALGSLAEGRMTLAYPIVVERDLHWSVTNRGNATVQANLELEYDDGLPDGTYGRFRADCSRRTGGEGNVVLIDLEERRGHYAGQALALRAQAAGFWALEGDHVIRADGSVRAQGTGVEDYFGGAFYFMNGPFALPLFGASGPDLGLPHAQRVPDSEAFMYRHHLLDGYAFEESFRFEIEVKEPGARYDACVYWYEHATVAATRTD